MPSLFTILSLLSLSLAHYSPQKPLSPAPTDFHHYGSDVKIASENANHIFNAIHSSMRQWGSSLNHNGMSFFPASVPAGTLLFHGTSKGSPVTGMDWLAFEIEHAEVFARTRGPGRGGPGGGGPPGRGPPPEGEKPGEEHAHLNEVDENDRHGYLHTYQAAHDLSLLYIDGMSAGKSDLGTLDTQDIFLLNWTATTYAPMREGERAKGLCELGAQWGIEGFLRMEAGFEIILCSFKDGLDLVSSLQRPGYDSPEGTNVLSQFEYVRGVGSRYQGIGGGRVEVDYSGMISAYFYPMNLSNPNPKPSLSALPRLVSADPAQLDVAKSDLKAVIAREKTHPTVDWQGIADMIVSRYSDRLKFMSTLPADKTLLSEANFLLNAFVDYEAADRASSVKRCASHYLLPAHVATVQDELIMAVFKTVTHKICETLFDVREDLLNEDENESEGDVSVHKKIEDLIKWLDWSTWTTCGQCDVDEVCFIAIWPWGGVEDHYNPSCRNNTQMRSRRGEGYWNDR